MHVIGLTGGIASGKSTAAGTLRALGAHVIDADAISRELTSPGGDAEPAILARFGTLDRRKLASAVFYDGRARQDLNNIVHPLVLQRIKAEIAASDAPIVVLDVPLLFESHMESLADEVWVVHVPREEQVRRIAARDGLNELEANARIDSQMPTEEKLRRADVAIDTTGSIAQTQMRLEDLWQQALAKVGAEPAQVLFPPAVRRHRSASRRTQQRQLEAEAANPQLSHTRPFEPLPNDAWEDTSTLLEIPEQRTFFAKQPPVFWVAMAALLVALLLVVGNVGVDMWREWQAEQAEARRLQQLAEEKARYRLDYRDLIEQYAYAQSLDPAFVSSVIYNESRFDPMAESRVGARGLMQIMKDTAAWIAPKLDEEEDYSFDLMYVPENNIRFGTWYLGFLSRMFDGDMVKVAAGYHAGQGSVQQWLQNPEYSSDGVTLTKIPFPDTEQYVQRVVSAYEMYKKHYFSPEAAQTATDNAA